MKNESNDVLKPETGSKLTDWKKEPSVSELEKHLDNAKPSHDLHVSRVKNWNDLREVKGKYRPKERKGRSSVQPKLVRRQAEWRYSALSEPFLGSEKLYEVKPRTWEDKKASQQNEIVLNWQMDTKLNKVKFIDEYVRTATDEGSVVVRLGWHREVRKEKKTVPVFAYSPAESETDIQMLTDAIKLEAENKNEYLDLPDVLRAAVDYYMENQIATVVTIDGEEEIEEDVIVENMPTLMLVRPENIYIDPACNGDYEKSKFIIMSYETTKSDLLKDGRFKNLENVNWGAENILAKPDHASSTPSDYQPENQLTKPVVAYEYWGYADIDGSEITVPISATWVGNTMIRMEKNPFPDEKPPFVIVPYLPVKREVMGEPDGEILEDNQTILGAITRGMIDLMGRSANAQQGFAKGFLDVTNKRKFDSGMDYEYNPGTDPRISVYQHSYPEIPNSALTLAQLQNQEAEALTGVKSFAGGVSGEAYGEVAAGIRGVLDASSKREMNILRRLAMGINQIGKKIISMNAVFLSEEEVVRVTNDNFVTVRREDLKGNFDLKVDISTAEVDEQKAQDLGFMLQTIGPNMDIAMRNMILAEIARLKRMPTLAKSIENYEPQPDPITEALRQAELDKMLIEIEKLRSDIEVNKSKVQENLASAEKDRTEINSDVSGLSHARDMEKQSGQAKGNQSLEVTKALLSKKKEGESDPNIMGAIGYNELEKLADNIGNQNPKPTAQIN